MRSSGDVPCQDDVGEDVLLGRVNAGQRDWSVESIINGPFYNAIRSSLQDGRPPWPGFCERCAFFRPHEAFSDSLAEKYVWRLQVEPSLACNLKCPCCSQPQQLLKRQKPFRMTLDVFEAMLRSLRTEGYALREIEYCGQGEPMTHADLHRFVDLGREIFPETRQRLITNGNFDLTKADLTAAIDEFVVSCDGARQESYSKYRVLGDLGKVLQFMRDVPRSVGGRRQQITWKYILFEFNDSDDELLEAQEIAADIGVDMLLFIVTHSRFKSLRFDSANAHQLPIVWDKVAIEATPLRSRFVRKSIPSGGSAWPAQTADAGVTFMLDELNLIEGGGMYLHGWLIAAEPAAHRLRIFANGRLVAETGINRFRPDVLAAYPNCGRANPGFACSWPSADMDQRTHSIDVEVLAPEGGVITSFNREFQFS